MAQNERAARFAAIRERAAATSPGTWPSIGLLEDERAFLLKEVDLLEAQLAAIQTAISGVTANVHGMIPLWANAWDSFLGVAATTRTTPRPISRGELLTEEERLMFAALHEYVRSDDAMEVRDELEKLTAREPEALALQLVLKGKVCGRDIVRASGARLSRGTIYPLLFSMAERGWLISEPNLYATDPLERGRHLYAITGLGVAVLRAWEAVDRVSR